jgi:cytochrome c553
MKHSIVPKPATVLLALLLVTLSGGLAAAEKASKGARTSKHASQGITCAQCHGKSAKKEVVPMQQCLSCHGDTKDLALRTAKVKPTNPHENRHFGTEADCNRCHHEHATSENLCLPCHTRFGFKVP